MYRRKSIKITHSDLAEIHPSIEKKRLTQLFLVSASIPMILMAENKVVVKINIMLFQVLKRQLLEELKMELRLMMDVV